MGSATNSLSSRVDVQKTIISFTDILLSKYPILFFTGKATCSLSSRKTISLSVTNLSVSIYAIMYFMGSATYSLSFRFATPKTIIIIIISLFVTYFSRSFFGDKTSVRDSRAK